MQNYSPENKFGGLVTFGSSHGGAPIINNKEMISTLAVEACDNIKDAVVEILVTESIGGLKPFARWFVETVRPGIIDPLVNKSFSDAKETFCSNFLPTILNTLFAAQLKPIGNDYAVGSQKLTELSQFSTTIPKISVYGIEENNHLWRTVHNMVVSPSADQPLFEAEDEGSVTFVNNLANSFLSERALSLIHI